MPSSPSLSSLRRKLRSQADPKTAKISARFFKTGAGEYGEGDAFLGIKVPQVRAIIQEFRGLPLQDIQKLLDSPWHEERLAALLLLVHVYERSDEKKKMEIFQFYLHHADRINNWDLVDLSAPNIVGNFLLHRSRKPLDALAKSKSLWKRRTAIVSTYAFIRNNEFDDALRICERLMRDKHDLIHKSCGWMLREVYKRSPKTLESFLKKHALSMPRTMLRYSIERMSEKDRRTWLRMKVSRTNKKSRP